MHNLRRLRTREVTRGLKTKISRRDRTTDDGSLVRVSRHYINLQ